MKIFLFLLLIFASAFVQAQMIRVSSTLIDAIKNEERPMEGVGSLIVADEKFYILTVGHVSLGQDLQLTGELGSAFQPLSRYDDYANDLTLIEVKPTERQSREYILATYRDQPSTGKLGLVAVVSNYFNNDDNATDWKINVLNFNKYRSLVVDGHAFAHPALAPRYDETRYDPAEILIASWLPFYPRQKWTELLLRHLLKWKEVSRSNDIKEFNLDIPFLPGYSGSPILIDQGHSMVSGFTPFNIGGILTLSNADSTVSSSHAVGPKVINNLIERAIRQKKNRDVAPTWFLLDGVFAKLDQELTVFRYDGPVGNGIAPTGKQINPSEVAQKIQKNHIIQQLEARMKNVNPSESTNSVESALRDLSTASSEKEIDQRKLEELKLKLQITVRIK